MTLIAVRSFNGQKPIVDRHLLDDSEAQLAQNVRLISGALSPLRGTTTLKATTLATPATIYRYGSSATETNYWLEFAQDTDVMRSPIANDAYDRLYWTDGNNKPRYAPNSLILSGNSTLPGASYELGIPKPASAPSITSYTPVATYTPINREYVMTFYNPTSTKESIPSSVYSTLGVDGQKVAFTNLTTDNRGDAGVTKKRIYRKVSGTYRRVAEIDLSETTYDDTTTDATLASGATITSSANPVKTPTRAPTLSFATPTSGVTALRVYMVTWVDSSGNESGKGPISAAATAVDGTTTIYLTHTESFDAGIAKKRLYRQTVVGPALITNDDNWKLVSEVSASVTSFADAVPDASLGATLNSSLRNLPASPTGTPTLKATIPNQVVPETRTYVVTYVSAYGEEGPPSDASASANVDPNLSVTVSLPGAPAGAYNIATKRIYRSSTVGSRAAFQFVAEIAVATGSYVDSVTQDNLGEVLPSETWIGPPAGLKGLRLMANGAAVGFVGRTIYLSEPNLPHAWPHQYTVDDDIVGIATFGQSVAVLTKSFPYVFTGVDPAAMSSTKLKLPQACVSKRSIVETGDGVVYASPDGMVQIGSNIGVVTQNLLSREQWQLLNPSTVEAYLHNGRIILFWSDNNTRGAVVFDLSGQGAVLTVSNINTTTAVTAGFYDPKTDILYLAQGQNIVRYDQGSSLTYLWKSKAFRLVQPMNLAFGQVVADSYPVTLRIYGGGALRHTQTVADSNPFRLPSGYRSRVYEFEVEGAVNVAQVFLASSMAELKAV
ncbi:MAG: hypothetical protein ACK42H_19295 [Planctomycetota bacterium]|jgi:hypothetical protein